MSIGEAMSRARSFFAEQVGPQAAVVAAGPREDGWRVVLEAVVEAEYMRQRAQRDLVAAYEVLLDADLNVIAFERKEVRERGTPISTA